jgi:hypothetical protein
MPKYITLAEELSNLSPDRQESIEARAMQIREEEINSPNTPAQNAPTLPENQRDALTS